MSLAFFKLFKPIKLFLKEDNDACRIAVTKGYSPSLRALTRTQRVSLGFMHDLIADQDLDENGEVRHERFLFEFDEMPWKSVPHAAG